MKKSQEKSKPLKNDCVDVEIRMPRAMHAKLEKSAASQKISAPEQCALFIKEGVEHLKKNKPTPTANHFNI